MKVAVVAYGSRGDVQPLVCIALELADRGHDAWVSAPLNGERMIRAAGLSFHALPVDFQTLLLAEPAQRMLAAGRLNAATKWLAEQERRNDASLRESLLAATEGADLILCGHLIDPRCRAIAEARGVPVVSVHPMPIVPSRRYPSAYLPQRDLGPLNRLSYQLPLEIFWRSQREGLTALRHELGLAPPRRADWYHGYSGQAPALIGYSHAVGPVADDWPERLHGIGFVKPSRRLRERLGEYGIPSELDAWLEAGPSPVFLGFGSMPVLDGGEMLRTIRQALSDVGARGILAAGWSELAAGGDDSLYVVGEVDHESLLPRCAAAVHHGGAGTTAASAGAGLPTLVCSVFIDQPFWGARCRRLGIGDTFPFAKLDARRLADGLRTVLRPEPATRAREIARLMAQEEDAAAKAADLLEAGLT